ncbi:muramoyltetrapeptide carboxypeptidase [Propionibacteriaceae bacterium ES.041]|uniref:S66 peptidase family protein n=1 Tax=Enemella evansiae TaxID=2016499 RepID=UPI000B96B0BD|nr:LD-carboxypeptidase [Enemella evansiae]OYO01017.1 LD-carboxypeptidase [Enemella evansiae]OYO03126.1 LD-carboxypeptidase [Enemella evansiae]PFG68236.1 muramoyltetrapeptide carboxypeptidase [Propionibacteriaceae bacterium ES.041]
MTDPLGPLVPGDRVALLGPAGPPPPEKLAAAEELLTGWGLVPVRLPSARAAHRWASYLSGADELRAADFQRAWCDPQFRGIIAVRGGYGTARMLDHLDLAALRSCPPKPVYGSSDITALHELLREQLGVPSWFTPMPATADLLDDPAATESFRQALFGDPAELDHAGSDALVDGTATGTLIGGNLSLLAMTLAARSRPPVDNTGALVLLEDINEETYHLDGYLTALLRAGWFDGVAGIVLGSWRGCVVDEVRLLVGELLGGLGVPIGAGFSFGHGPGAESVPLGVPARLQVGAGTSTLIVTPGLPPTTPDSGK